MNFRFLGLCLIFLSLSFQCAYALEQGSLSPLSLSKIEKCLNEEVANGLSPTDERTKALAESKDLSRLIGHGVSRIFPYGPGKYIVSVDDVAAGKIPRRKSDDPDTLVYYPEQYIGVVDTAKDKMDPQTWKTVGPFPPVSKIAGVSGNGELILGLNAAFGRRLTEVNVPLGYGRFRTEKVWMDLRSPYELIAVDIKTGQGRELINGTDWGVESSNGTGSSLAHFRNWYPSLKPVALSESVHMPHPKTREVMMSIDTTPPKPGVPIEKSWDRLTFGGSNEDFELKQMVKVIDAEGTEKIWSIASAGPYRRQGAIIEIDPKNPTAYLPRSVNPWVRAEWLAAAPDGKTVVVASKRFGLTKDEHGRALQPFDFYLLNTSTGQALGHVLIERLYATKGTDGGPEIGGLWTDGRTAFMNWRGSNEADSVNLFNEDVAAGGVHPDLVPNLPKDPRAKPVMGLPVELNQNSILFTDNAGKPSAILYNLEGRPDQNKAAMFKIKTSQNGTLHPTLAKPFTSRKEGYFRGPVFDQDEGRILAIDGNRLVEMDLKNSTAWPIAKISVELDRTARYPELNPAMFVLKSQDREVFDLQMHNGTLHGISSDGTFTLEVPPRDGFFGKMKNLLTTGSTRRSLASSKDKAQLGDGNHGLVQEVPWVNSLTVKNAGSNQPALNTSPRLEDFSVPRSAQMDPDAIAYHQLIFKEFPKEMKTSEEPIKIVTGIRLPSGETLAVNGSNHVFRVSQDGSKVLETQALPLPEFSRPVQIKSWNGKIYYLVYVQSDSRALTHNKAVLYELNSGPNGMSLANPLDLGEPSLHPTSPHSAILTTPNALYVAVEDRLYQITDGQAKDAKNFPLLNMSSP